MYWHPKTHCVSPDGDSGPDSKELTMSLLLRTMPVAIAVVLTAGCAASSGDTGGEAADPGKPDVVVKAGKILREFEENEAAADGKYKGKVLRVNGVVDKVDTELIDDNQYVVNVGAGGDFVITTVNCDDQTSKAVSKIKKGQRISVVGEFEDGGDLGIELKNCQIR